MNTLAVIVLYQYVYQTYRRKNQIPQICPLSREPEWFSINVTTWSRCVNTNGSDELLILRLERRHGRSLMSLCVFFQTRHVTLGGRRDLWIVGPFPKQSKILTQVVSMVPTGYADVGRISVPFVRFDRRRSLQNEIFFVDCEQLTSSVEVTFMAPHTIVRLFL